MGRFGFDSRSAAIKFVDYGLRPFSPIRVAFHRFPAVSESCVQHVKVCTQYASLSPALSFSNELRLSLPLLFRSLLRLFPLSFFFLPPKFGGFPVQITLSPLRYRRHRALISQFDHVKDALKLLLQQLIPAICNSGFTKALLLHKESEKTGRR
ncbi:hypothetical protein BG24_3082 [Burkholderia pseudomallei PB08298010]|nr:hypothetical protein BG24_3082 [Burkholderia pseudomallei PB08298010]